jgi:Protein of unknown function DUF262
MKFKDIPQIEHANYSVNIPVSHLLSSLESYRKDYGLDIDPDFQRMHVWTESQQIRYVEWIFKGGRSGREILWNSPGWMKTGKAAPLTLVDGKQRLESLRRFLQNEIPIFRTLYQDFKDRLSFYPDVVFYINNLTKRVDVLKWYRDFNAGGTIHTEDEIRKVDELIEKEIGRK